MNKSNQSTKLRDFQELNRLRNLAWACIEMDIDKLKKEVNNT
jgi:hypothetical protein